MKYLITVLIFLNFLYSNSITIYSNNLAFINQNYDTNLSKSTDKIVIKNLPKTVIANSIFVSNLDLVSKVYLPKDSSYVKNLIEANLDSKVGFVYNKKELSGKLVNKDPIIIKSDKRVYIIKNPSSIIYSRVPKYQSSSKLVLYLQKKETVKRVDLNYLLNSVSWSANYIINLKKNSLNLELWAEINNRSGADFNNYKIELIAGEINRATHPRVAYKNTRALASPAVAMDKTLSVDVKPVSGYYSFEIPKKQTVKKHLQLLIDKSKDIKYKEYAIATNQSFYRYNQTKLNFTKQLEFENKKTNNLGKILPHGIARVYKSGYYLGEDRVKNTPKNEIIKLNIGKVFDAVGSKKIVEYKENKHYKKVTTKYTLKNRGKTSLTIKLYENIQRYGSKISYNTSCKNNCSLKERDAFKKEFTINLEQGKKYEFTTSFEVYY